MRLGNRHKGFNNFVSTAGKIDWHEAMSYEITWTTLNEQTTATQINRKYGCKANEGGGSVSIKRLVITDDFNVLEPWDDMRRR